MAEKKSYRLPYIGPEQIAFLETILSLRDESSGIDLNSDNPHINRESLLAKPDFPAAEYHWSAIRMLGAASDKMRQEKQVDDLAIAAHLLVSSDKPFGLACRANPASGIDFLIGFSGTAENSFNTANSFLSAAFGIVRLEDDAPDELSANQVTWVGNLTPVKRDFSLLDGQKDIVRPSRWADAVATSMIGTRCSCKLLCYPMKSTDKECKPFYEAEKKLLAYLKQRTQLSCNGAFTQSDGANKGRLNPLNKKSDSQNEGSTTTLNISHDVPVFDPETSSLEEDVRFLLRLLEQAGWYVRLCVTSSGYVNADDDPDALLVRAALSSALLPLGFQCEWHKDTSKVSGIFPRSLLPALISFPTKPCPGLSIKHRSKLEVNIPPSASGESIRIGTIMWNDADTEIPFSIPRTDLNRHTTVFGMTGGGKTNTVCSLLNQLEDLHYLVIEPVKGEYHALPGIKRYTMLADDASALRMNPFWFPEKGSLQYHVDSLKLILSSAFDLYAAMPNILEQCLYRIYANCGWNIVSGRNLYRGQLPEEDLYPTFSDLCNEIQHYLDESGFDGEVADNYKGALLSRLQSFTNGAKGLLLNTGYHADFQNWAADNVVVELDALADDADKAIVMGTLMTQYFQHIKSSHSHNNQLNHLFVLEEAHHLFKSNSKPSSNGSDASGQLVSFLNNMLAEIRAYGEGFIIVDQSPSSVSTSVLKNTAVKIIHRVDYGEDIKLLQSALLLDDDDFAPASLEPGKALIRFGSMQSPALVKIPHYPKEDAPMVERKPIEVDLTDRLTSNQAFLDQLEAIGEQLIHLFICSSDRETICLGLKTFRDETKRMVAQYLGSDLVSSVTYHTMMQVMEKAILRSSQKFLPEQYCIHRMLRMLIVRAEELRYENASGVFSEKAWSILRGYRDAMIFPRLRDYYLVQSDNCFRLIAAVLGSLPEMGILKSIINVMWDIFQEDKATFEKRFLDEIEKQFIVLPTLAEIEYLKNLVREYCEAIENMD